MHNLYEHGELGVRLDRRDQPSEVLRAPAPKVFQHLYRKVDIRLHGKENSKSHGARPVYYNHLDDKVDLDQ